MNCRISIYKRSLQSNKMSRALTVAIVLVAVHLFNVSACPTSCACHVGRTNCRNVSLTSIPDDLDVDTSVIDISFNKISVLHNEDFANAKHVDTLFLDHNGITEIQPYVFYWTNSLKRLYLSNNKIVRLNTETFKHLTNLKFLSLKNNELEELDPTLFEVNINLLLIDLSDNKIKALDIIIFQYNPLLTWVNLKNNPLFTIDWTGIMNTSLNVIDVDFCGKNIAFSEIHKIPSLKIDKFTGENSMSLDEFTSYNFKGITEEESTLLKYKIFHDLYDLEYGTVSNLVIGKDFNVVTSMGERILCYCEQNSLWFWCADSVVCVDEPLKYSLLNCSSQIPYDVVSIQDNTKKEVSDVKKNSKFHLIINRAIDGETIRKTLIYASIPGCLVVIVAVGFIVKRIKRRKERALHQNLSSYEELRNMSLRM
ncbi:hypothetical protein C0J52_22242 [Blattella germanica]|nr:hypothetical protein C0J52_22242 [Blattella germanica]